MMEMETTPNEAFLVCDACAARNKSEAANCAQCGTDLLPGRRRIVRLLFGVMGIIGIGIPIFMLVTLKALPGFIPAILLIFMITAGFSGALTRSPASERFVNRAERHLHLNPRQAVIDATKAFEQANTGALRCLALETRGEAHMALGQYTEAISDFRRCLTVQPDNSYARGLMRNITKKAQSKLDEIMRIQGSGNSV